MCSFQVLLEFRSVVGELFFNAFEGVVFLVSALAVDVVLHLQWLTNEGGNGNSAGVSVQRTNGRVQRMLQVLLFLVSSLALLITTLVDKSATGTCHNWVKVYRTAIMLKALTLKFSSPF